ncbi:ZIP family metal transporter [Azospirillum sp. A1-3]|uniref:ZIP family metal transporter n=1 Tax=Azospirillum sp. A1-3 TaxID=185874 RepID=UPI002076FBCC|nr:ZIP family metal transporter [Azospirillum sp. A1-3]MCM8738480.1 ZIP family metal transporter [Azospirillum sp. A1-3]
MSLLTLTLLAAALLALVHVVTPSLRFLDGTPRSIWLSIAGGVSVSYVFVHFLPELAAAQETIQKAAGGIQLAERHVYLIALVGLLTFYGLDRMAKTSRSRASGKPVRAGRGGEAGEEATSREVFWVHMASFSIYNALIGYLLLHREQMTTAALVFFTVAMALHFIVTDYGLNEDHKAPYQRIGRWVLIAALLAGWAIGATTEVSEAAIGALTAFLGGGVVLNVLKEEVPSERRSRFWAFGLGAAGYAGLLLTV